MRFSAPPAATTSTPSEQRGQALFVATGCSLCHSETLRTRATGAPGLSGATIHPYSDFALHHMGPGLADHVSQGLAGGDEFRTAPLWGLGQRIFFLHDGRTTDLLEAVEVHASAAAACPATPDAPPGQEACASEADAVIARFNGLPKTARSDLLAFLRSL